MNLKKLSSVALFAVLASSASGCVLAKISGSGPRELLLNNYAGKFDVIKHFDVEKDSRWDATNTVEIDKMVADVLNATNADAIVNLHITVKEEVGDYFCNAFTCGIAHAKTYQIEGDAIRFK